MPPFDRYAAIDWSGAKGERHKGIAIAWCDANGGPPALLEPGRSWSRTDVLRWLRDLASASQRTLVGMDLGISLPYADCGAFFPGAAQSPGSAKALWALVDGICSGDPHLGAGTFVDHSDFAEFFRRHGGREGTRFRCDGAEHGRGRFRVTELRQQAMGCKPYSNFNLVGAAQVGKSSLTGMRVLHHLRGTLPVWPVDPAPRAGSAIVEIYTTIAAMAAGRRPGRAKMRRHEDIDAALQALGSPPLGREGPVDDHSADALVTAAWLRNAAAKPDNWTPQALTPSIARTEGWTFGVR
ncbi:hypothetical protein B5C34_10545 [Pacificimonas flava]|uniref:DUF429 domain-containing protein n=2 Tax=Pacificimonas TaxID=1960290 RepID=A0A219B6X2_9SPHN|nr:MULTISPECIES: hypothetical protein [Pacificimonas]MBZ6378892.1 hypothetical protein [Pacificimonas aurantium]OWV33856.1 hypothetical protein B5C34_10545 [Pacificimonas flava]